MQGGKVSFYRSVKIRTNSGRWSYRSESAPGSAKAVAWLKRALTTKTDRISCRLLPESEFEEQQGGSEQQSEKVGGDHRDVIDGKTVHKPHGHAETKKRKHAQGKVFGRAALPGFNNLGQERSGG